MHAFLRFRPVAGPDGPLHVAWFEPDHHILEAEAGGFFARRFTAMRWSILTPAASAHWDGAALRMGPGARRGEAPAEDAGDALWRTYFAAIFNPARLKPAAMRAEMPVKYWRNLPEAQAIPRLMAEAPARAAAMVARGATPPAPRRQRDVHRAIRPPALPGARADAAQGDAALAGRGAQGGLARGRLGPDRLGAGRLGADHPCPDRPVHDSRDHGADAAAAQGIAAPADAAAALAALAAALRSGGDLPGWVAQATQPVFGEGPPGAALCLVGEQPGDAEDLAGRPFVGPAGRLLDAVLAAAGIPRAGLYVTNAVKHFKFRPTGRRRLHQSPDAGDIAHYRPFLRQELALVRPRLVVALGATALHALTGRPLAIGPVRGRLIATEDGVPLLPTVHPAYLLRLPDPAARAAEEGRFLDDLRRAAAALG
jgi:DNA polymerase